MLFAVGGIEFSRGEKTDATVKGRNFCSAVGEMSRDLLTAPLVGLSTELGWDIHSACGGTDSGHQARSMQSVTTY